MTAAEVDAQRVKELLSKLCKTLEQEGADWAMPPDVRSWWKEHQVEHIRVRYRNALKELEQINDVLDKIRNLGGLPGDLVKMRKASIDKEFLAAEADYLKL